MAAVHGEEPAYDIGTCGLPDFAEAVLAVVDQIPQGRVLAYGDVAEMLAQGGARQVASVLSRYGSSVAWWRVTRASGELPAALRDEAVARWRTEGTAMVGGALAGRRVDMTRARWDGMGEQAAQTLTGQAGMPTG